MKLIDILTEEEIEVTGIVDDNTADRFLSRMDKEEIDVSHPAVTKKLQKIQSIIKNLNAADSKYKTLTKAADKLSAWLKAHQLRRVTNPAGTNMNRNL